MPTFHAKRRVGGDKAACRTTRSFPTSGPWSCRSRQPPKDRETASRRSDEAASDERSQTNCQRAVKLDAWLTFRAFDPMKTAAGLPPHVRARGGETIRHGFYAMTYITVSSCGTECATNQEIIAGRLRSASRPLKIQSSSRIQVNPTLSQAFEWLRVIVLHP